ncbi:MAG: hypothetical protein R3B48_13005 [Kofleriaceae bacterium]
MSRVHVWLLTAALALCTGCDRLSGLSELSFEYCGDKTVTLCSDFDRGAVDRGWTQNLEGDAAKISSDPALAVSPPRSMRSTAPSNGRARLVYRMPANVLSSTLSLSIDARPSAFAEKHISLAEFVCCNEMPCDGIYLRVVSRPDGPHLAFWRGYNPDPKATEPAKGISIFEDPNPVQPGFQDASISVTWTEPIARYTVTLNGEGPAGAQDAPDLCALRKVDLQANIGVSVVTTVLSPAVAYYDNVQLHLETPDSR